MRTASVIVIVIFSEVPFWNLPDHSYVQSSFSAITKHIDILVTLAFERHFTVEDFTEMDQYNLQNKQSTKFFLD